MGNIPKYKKLEALLTSFSEDAQREALDKYLDERNPDIVCGFVDRLYKAYNGIKDKPVLVDWLNHVKESDDSHDILRALLLWCVISPRLHVEEYLSRLDSYGVDYASSELCYYITTHKSFGAVKNVSKEVKRQLRGQITTEAVEDDDKSDGGNGDKNMSDEKYVKKIIEYIPPTRIEMDEVTLHTLNLIADSLKVLSVANNEDMSSSVLALEEEMMRPLKAASDYTVDDFLEKMQGIDESLFDDLKNILLLKGWLNIVGEPGTGKSTLARTLAYSVVGQKDSKYTYLVSFNEITSYEDFIGGLRQVNGRWEYVKGMFTLFCEMAMRDQDHLYVFIVDELNRANAASVFGEVITAIENRDEPVHTNRGLSLTVPRNVKLISTCNTLDNSTSKLDDAFHSRMAEFRMPKAPVEYIIDACNIQLASELADKVRFVYQKVEEINKYLARNVYKKQENCIGLRFLYVACATVEELKLVIQYDYIPQVERKRSSLQPSDIVPVDRLLNELRREFNIPVVRSDND